MSHFVFFHVGSELQMPADLVTSIRHFMPDAFITQCSDTSTPTVDSVNEVLRTEVNPEFLMLGRTAAFSKVVLRGPAAFVDTDMLVQTAFELPSSARTLLCRRSFDRDTYFNANFRGMDFSEYSGKTLDEVYPILACFTVSDDSDLWRRLHAKNLTLPQKFHRWYGDQEVLRLLWRGARPNELGLVEESEFACLPERNTGNAKLLHFKGSERKALMKASIEKLRGNRIEVNLESEEKRIERAKTLFLKGSEALQRGDSESAVASFESALELASGHLGIMVALGAAYVALERLDDARRYCDAVLQQGLGIAEGWNLLGVINQKLGRTQEGLACFEKALSLKPGFADAALNLARVLIKLKLPQHALELAESVIASGEMVTEAMQLKAEAFTAMNEENEAFAVYNASISRRPTAAALADRAHILMKRALYSEARADLEQSLALSPQHFISLYNMGSVLKDTGDFQNALKFAEQALRVSPLDADSRYLQSVLRLMLGDLSGGWEHFDARFSIPESPVPRRINNAYQWDFDPCDRLVVWGEQGIGEEVLFSSCLHDARPLTKSMALVVNPKLKSLMQRTFPEIEVFGYLDVDGLLYTHHVAMGDLAKHFRQSLECFDGRPRSSLRPDATRVAAIGRELQAKVGRGLRVGITWFSGRDEFSRSKSVPLDSLRPLLEVEGVQFINLQYGPIAREADGVRVGTGSSMVRLASVDPYDDLEGLAALIENCDVVVAASNTTAHIAAALGKPVLLMLPLGPGHFWYWHCGVLDKPVPWYPDVHRFLQREPGEWGPVVTDVAAEVRRLMA